MKEFFKVMRRYVAPYKRYMIGSLIFNLLSAVLNVFSFASLIPMLNLLFKVDKTVYGFIAWDDAAHSMKDILVNNMYYYTQQIMQTFGPSTTLLLIGLFLVTATLLKTSCYFASAGMLVPMRTGIVRDIRSHVYHKITNLPLSFFSDERKGDIIARMSGDVNEIDHGVARNAHQKPDSSPLLFQRVALHQLATHRLHHRCSPADGVGDGKNRPTAEAPEPRRAKQMERDHVSA